MKRKRSLTQTIALPAVAWAMLIPAGTASANFFSPFDPDSPMYEVSDITPPAPMVQQVADNFQMSQSYNAASQVLRVEWWGGIAPPPGPGQLETLDFRIRIYANEPLSSPAMPTVTPLSEHFVTATGTVVPVSIHAEMTAYRYQVDLTGGVSLDTGTTYWLSIVDNDPDTGQAFSENFWMWGPSITEGDFALRVRDTGNWTVNTAINRAFRLTVLEVPEPTSMVLLGCGFPLYAASRRRRKRRLKTNAA